MPPCWRANRNPCELAAIELWVPAKTTSSRGRSQSSTCMLQPASAIAAWATFGACNALTKARPPKSIVALVTAIVAVTPIANRRPMRWKCLAPPWPQSTRAEQVEQPDGAGDERDERDDADHDRGRR